MTPPSDLDAERAVLSCLLSFGDECADDVVAHIPKPNAFHDQRHRLIYRACAELVRDALPTDSIHVAARLEALQTAKGPRNVLEDAGGRGFLMELAMLQDSSGNAVHYAKRVQEVATKRNMIALGEHLVKTAGDSTKGAQEALAEANRALDAFTGNTVRSEIVTIAEVVDKAAERMRLKNRGDSDGIPTGFSHYDYRGGGLRATDFNILAARPSMGKTAFALNIAYNISRGGVSVGFFSQEMDDAMTGNRTLSYLSGFDSMRIQNKRIDAAEEEEILQRARLAHELPIHIDFNPALTLEAFRAGARRMVTHLGCQVLILDYLTFMVKPKAENNTLAVALLSRGLKQVAKDLKVNVLALAQLSRVVEGRNDKRPLMSDLRESGAIEQDADEVAFLYRPIVYDSGANPRSCELIVGKKRNGPTGTYHLNFDRETGRFSDVNPHDPSG